MVIYKSGANLAGMQAVNVILKFTGTGKTVEILQIKYLNSIFEQDHSFIKRITAPMIGADGGWIVSQANLRSSVPLELIEFCDP